MNDSNLCNISKLHNIVCFSRARYLSFLAALKALKAVCDCIFMAMRGYGDVADPVHFAALIGLGFFQLNYFYVH